jgi:hypothetical protein
MSQNITANKFILNNEKDLFILLGRKNYVITKNS